MSRKKRSPPTRFDFYLYFLGIILSFVLFVCFLSISIGVVRGWMQYSAIESVLRKEGIECEGKITSWENELPSNKHWIQFRQGGSWQIQFWHQGAWSPTVEFRYRKWGWYPTVEYLDQYENTHTFKSPRLRSSKRTSEKSLSVTFARSDPAIVLDNEARTYFPYRFPFFFITYLFATLFAGACFVGFVYNLRGEYERNLPKAERKRRRRERKRRREQKQRDGTL